MTSEEREKILKEYQSELGKKGGPATLKKYGLNHYSLMGKRSGEVRKRNSGDRD